MFTYQGRVQPLMSHLEEPNSCHVQGCPNGIPYTYLPPRLNTYTNMYGDTRIPNLW